MKVETPQILWHNEEDKGINAALSSVSMLQSGIVGTVYNGHNSMGMGGPISSEYGNVLATAGNSKLIHLWNVSFPAASTATGAPDSSSSQQQQQQHNIPTATPVAATSSSSSFSSSFTKTNTVKIDYQTSLTRHEGSVGVVAFSPDGLHLASASETGTIIIWSVPINKRANGNGRHFWATCQEKDLLVKILHAAQDGLPDLSWAKDSKRFVAGSVENSVLVCELVDSSPTTTTTSSSSTSTAPAEQPQHQAPQIQPAQQNWRIVFKNGIDHQHFVQGVAYDPLAVYLASQSSDRSVRIFSRKPPKACKKVKKQLLKSSSNQHVATASTSASQPHIQQQVQSILAEAKLEMATRSKEMRKFSTTKMCDEATLQSFVRRLAWTPDGAYLIVPAAVVVSDTTTTTNTAVPNNIYATLMFARHSFDEPARILGGLEKPSVAVVPNPVLFTIPTHDDSNAAETSISDAKENRLQRKINYRSLFCVLTWDTVLLYDTYHRQPLAVIKGLHYANLVDATWSADGHTLVVCSTDGYISFIKFSPGELGTVYKPPPEPSLISDENASIASTVSTSAKLTASPSTKSLLPPCDPGPVAVLETRPTKKARVAPILITTAPPSAPRFSDVMIEVPASTTCAKRCADVVIEAVDKLTLEQQPPPNKKMKKRIQPVLLQP